jgi:hypothetical protein
VNYDSLVNDATYDDLYPEFRRRSDEREDRYKVLTEDYSPNLPPRDQGIESEIAKTAAKISKNFHIAAYESRWSLDSSDAESADLTELSLEPNEPEVWQFMAPKKRISLEVKSSQLKPHWRLTGTGITLSVRIH